MMKMLVSIHQVLISTAVGLFGVLFILGWIEVFWLITGYFPGILGNLICLALMIAFYFLTKYFSDRR